MRRPALSSLFPKRSLDPGKVGLNDDVGRGWLRCTVSSILRTRSRAPVTTAFEPSSGKLLVQLPMVRAQLVGELRVGWIGLDERPRKALRLIELDARLARPAVAVPQTAQPEAVVNRCEVQPETLDRRIGLDELRRENGRPRPFLEGSQSLSRAAIRLVHDRSNNSAHAASTIMDRVSTKQTALMVRCRALGARRGCQSVPGGLLARSKGRQSLMRAVRLVHTRSIIVLGFGELALRHLSSVQRPRFDQRRRRAASQHAIEGRRARLGAGFVPVEICRLPMALQQLGLPISYRGSGSSGVCAATSSNRPRRALMEGQAPSFT